MRLSATVRLPTRLRRRLLLYLALVSILAITAVLWRFCPDIGGNLFSEALGIGATVLIVERLIRWEDEARLQPARLAAFRDAMTLSHVAREFLLSLSRSALPASEMHRVAREPGPLPATWLAEPIAQLTKDTVAPYGAPPPWGRGSETWGSVLMGQVREMQRLVGRYLERHAAHADPILTEAVHDFEDNGLFRILSYGDGIFWGGDPSMRKSMYEHFIEKLRKLVDVTKTLSPEYSQGSPQLAATGFEWGRLLIELEHNPHATPTAPWRPASQ